MQQDLPEETTLLSRVGITRIVVHDLFGQYTYTLSDNARSEGSASKVLLLYGDNGSGKTTILNLLFNLLSPVDARGHKTAVSKIRFKKFQVEFLDGTEVVALRSDLQKKPYALTIKRNGKEVASCSYPDREPGDEPHQLNLGSIYSVAKDLTREKKHAEVLAALQDLQLGIIYLTETRKVLTTVADLPSAEEEEHGVFISQDNYVIRSRGSDSGEAKQVTRAVEQISAWATRQAFMGTTQGEEDANTVYASLIQSLAANAPATDITLDGLISNLKVQEKRAEEFVRFGLTKPVKTQPIIDALMTLGVSARTPALDLLKPYVSGIEKRLDALDPIREQLSSFTDLMNSFFGSSKSVYLNVNDGIRIVARNSDELAPALLSSGERQLLYLLASTIVAKEKSHIFMIDEPEISLNVRWQRKLISALLDLTRDANIQFVLATHSVELLTRYEDCVLDLEAQS